MRSRGSRTRYVDIGHVIQLLFEVDISCYNDSFIFYLLWIKFDLFGYGHLRFCSISLVIVDSRGRRHYTLSRDTRSTSSCWLWTTSRASSSFPNLSSLAFWRIWSTFIISITVASTSNLNTKPRRSGVVEFAVRKA